MFSVVTCACAETGSNPTAGNTGRSSSSGFVVHAKVRRDTVVIQRLARIERVNEDGDWILATNGDIPLLDRVRGAEDSETMTRVIRRNLVDAGINPLDTIVKALSRRVKRYLDVYRLKKDGFICETPSGYLSAKESPDNVSKDDPVAILSAQYIVEDENRDRRILRREVEKQE